MDLPYTYLYIPDFPIPHSPEANAWWQLSDDRVSFSAPPIAWPLLSFPSSPVGSSVWGIACRLAYAPRNGICPAGCAHSPTVSCTANTVRHDLHASGNIGVSSARPPIFLPLCDCFSLLIVWRCFELLMMSWGYIYNIQYKYKTYFSNNRHLSMFFHNTTASFTIAAACWNLAPGQWWLSPVTICIYISINSDVVFPQYREQVCL